MPGATSFVGTWRLVSFEVRYSDGEVAFPYGQGAVGRLTYDARGNMSAQMISPSVPRFSHPDWTRATPDEARAAFLGALSYLGTYEVHEAEGVVTHKVEASLFPNWAGTEQRRRFALSGDCLTLSTPDLPHGERTFVATMIWQRAGD